MEFKKIGESTLHRIKFLDSVILHACTATKWDRVTSMLRISSYDPKWLWVNPYGALNQDRKCLITCHSCLNIDLCQTVWLKPSILKRFCPFVSGFPLSSFDMIGRKNTTQIAIKMKWYLFFWLTFCQFVCW